MREYIVNFFFWIFFTLMLYGFGKVLCKDKKSNSFYFVTGYLTYSLVVAVGGITVQLANFSWKVFAAFMIIVWGMIAGLIVVRRKAFQLASYRLAIMNYLKDNWILLFVCLFLCGMLFLYYNAFWYGNHLDDGYYVTKVATMPYNATNFRTNYSVGIQQSGIDSYIFNTWELEASFYVKILNVKATLFLRLFQSAFQYFLALNCLKLLAEQIFMKFFCTLKLGQAQLITVIALLFGGFYIYLMDTNLFFVRDMFQFNSAMFYGGSIVKVLALLLLLLFFIEVDELNIRVILIIMGISVVLISKSSIALPIIIITAFAYLVVYIFCHYGKQGRFLSLILVMAYLTAGIIIPGNNAAQKEVYTYVLTALKSPAVLVCIPIFVISFFLKNETIKRLNSVMLVIMSAMLIPQVNDLFEVASVYKFVAGRAWTTWVYTFVILNTIYLYLLLSRLLKNGRVIKYIYLAGGIVLIATDAIGFDKYGGELFITEEPVEANIKYNLRTILENPYFVPSSTIELGNVLENVSKTTDETVRVVMPEGVDLDGTVHNLAVQIRTFAPSIVSVSASGRYPVSSDSELQGYSQEYYDAFVQEPSQKTMEDFENELVRSNINCVVVKKAECGEYLSNAGYTLFEVINDGEYYVWCSSR